MCHYDEYENLPWPDYDKILKVWINLEKDFVSSQRYFLGQPIRPEILKDKLVKKRLPRNRQSPRKGRKSWQISG